MSANWMDAIKKFTDGVKEGVITNNIDLVRESLEEFMGERLAGMSVKEIENSDKDEEDLDEALQMRIDLEDFKEESRQNKSDDDFTMPVSETTDNSKQRLTKSKSLDLEDRENQFIDDGSLKVDEAGADLINDQSVKPVRRERNPSPGLMSITCHLCGKSELIAPSLKREHYRCSACCKG